MINRVVCAYTAANRPVFHLYRDDKIVGRARTPQDIAKVVEVHGGPAPVIRGRIVDTHAEAWDHACELL
jgi:hypothetical protein